MVLRDASTALSLTPFLGVVRLAETTHRDKTNTGMVMPRKRHPPARIGDASNVQLTAINVENKHPIDVDNMNKIVYIDSRSDLRYISSYLFTLLHTPGVKCRWNKSKFADLPNPGNDMRMIINDLGGESSLKVYVHTNDSYEIVPENYDWCDVYASVNANFEHYPKADFPKLVSIVPSFAVRVYGPVGTLWYAFRTLCMNWTSIWNRSEWSWTENKSVRKPITNLKKHLTRAMKSYTQRRPLAEYEKAMAVMPDYVFHVSTLWPSDEYNKNDENCNLRRAHFIRACKSIPQLCFEGGLVGNRPVFEDVKTQGVDFDTYITKTKQSILAFNTPAFLNCHGWKLGEYLAMGKCIVSTKLHNDLPCPLEHGVNVHFVEDGEEAMREAVAYIMEHPEYRKKLEQGAREYWKKYGNPTASLHLIGVL